MSAADTLRQAADVLEKTAEYMENSESVRINEQNAERMKSAQVLADKIAQVTGEAVEPQLVEKLSAMGTDVQSIIGRLTDGGEVDSLGGPDESTKLASIDGGLPPEDVRFLAYLQS